MYSQSVTVSDSHNYGKCAENAAFEREKSDGVVRSNLQVVGIDDRSLSGGDMGTTRVKLTGPNVCTQQEP